MSPSKITDSSSELASVCRLSPVLKSLSSQFVSFPCHPSTLFAFRANQSVIRRESYLHLCARHHEKRLACTRSGSLPSTLTKVDLLSCPADRWGDQAWQGRLDFLKVTPRAKNLQRENSSHLGTENSPGLYLLYPQLLRRKGTQRAFVPKVLD